MKFGSIETLDGIKHDDGPWTRTRFQGYDPSIYWENPHGDMIPGTAVRRLWAREK